MAFVYEAIADADIDRFNLYKTQDRYGLSKTPLNWSFDRETDTYLRHIGSDREVPGRECFEYHHRGITEQLFLVRGSARRAACGIRLERRALAELGS